jgi:hypothetical protein
MLSENYTVDTVYISIAPALTSPGNVQTIKVSINHDVAEPLCAGYDGPSSILGNGTAQYINVGYGCLVDFTIQNTDYYFTWNYIATYQLYSCQWNANSTGPVHCPLQNLDYVQGGQSPAIGASIQSDTFSHCFSCLTLPSRAVIGATAGEQLLILVNMQYDNPENVGGGFTAPGCGIADSAGTNMTGVYGNCDAYAFSDGPEDVVWVFTSGRVPTSGADTITLTLHAGTCFHCGMGGHDVDAGIFANVTIAVYAIADGPIGIDQASQGFTTSSSSNLSVPEYTACGISTSPCYTNGATSVVVVTIGYVPQDAHGLMGDYTAGAGYTLAENQTAPGVIYNAGWGTSEYSILPQNHDGSWPGTTSPETIGAAPGGWMQFSVDWFTQAPNTLVVYVVIPPNPGTVGFWFFPLLIILFFALFFLYEAGHNGASTWARNYMFLTGLVVGCIVAMELEVLEGFILLLGLIIWIFYAYRG